MTYRFQCERCGEVFTRMFCPLGTGEVVCACGGRAEKVFATCHIRRPPEEWAGLTRKMLNTPYEHIEAQKRLEEEAARGGG